MDIAAVHVYDSIVRIYKYRSHIFMMLYDLFKLIDMSRSNIRWDYTLAYHRMQKPALRGTQRGLILIVPPANQIRSVGRIML